MFKLFYWISIIPVSAFLHIPFLRQILYCKYCVPLYLFPDFAEEVNCDNIIPPTPQNYMLGFSTVLVYLYLFIYYDIFSVQRPQYAFDNHVHNLALRQHLFFLQK